MPLENGEEHNGRNDVRRLIVLLATLLAVAVATAAATAEFTSAHILGVVWNGGDRLSSLDPLTLSTEVRSDFRSTAARSPADVLDSEEAVGPTDGDANADGIPDTRQANVASLRNAATGEYVTLVSSPGTTLVNLQASPAPDDAPPGVSSPLGSFCSITVPSQSSENARFGAQLRRWRSLVTAKGPPA